MLLAKAIGMSTLDGWNNSFGSGKIFKCFHCFIICHWHIFRSSDIIKVCMFRSDTRVIQSCGNRVNRSNLSIFILTEVGLHTMEDAQTTGSNRSRCLCGIDTSSCCLTTDKTHIFIFNKIIKCSNGIGAAAHAGQYSIRKSALFFQHLFLDLFGNHSLKISHNGRKWMRAHN